MIKKAILLLSALAGLGSAAIAQPCLTDQVHAKLIKENPQVKATEDALNAYLRGAFMKLVSSSPDYDKYFDSMYTEQTKETLYIPLAVHIVHDYGTEYVSDDEVFQMVKDLNNVWQQKNDLSSVIDIYKPYIGKMNFEFRLARKDPNGNPTTGITRHFSYLTRGGDEQAKFDLWAPDKYVNIWVEGVIGSNPDNGITLAYAFKPSGGASNPQGDGIIVAAPYITDGGTIPHEMGHVMNLDHPWNSSGVGPGEACGNDEVDDTPPTKGHFSTCPLYDTVCAKGYSQTYTFAPPGGGATQTVIVNYPDTTNVQNLMDYSNCTNMFTMQQVLRVRNAVHSTVANRVNLLSDLTKTVTGIMEPQNDLTPVADFSVERKGSQTTGDRTVYMCADNAKEFIFKNRSWRDTITSINFEFPGGNPSTSTQKTNNVLVKFGTPGWINVKLTANGNNTGSSTVERQAIYAADPGYKLTAGYFQEFDANGDKDKWPIFNYYNNATKWQTTETGYYDNSGLMFTGYDSRIFPATYTGNPGGDNDDFFTPLFDLSSMTSGDCNVNFMSAGAYRVTNPELMNDALLIGYSIDCGATWKKMDSLKTNELANYGTYTSPFRPLWTGDWKLHSMNIPGDARTSNVMFRFRYRSSVDPNTAGRIGTGNNFYIDRINVSPYPLGVNTLLNGNDITVYPNPTNGNAFVAISNNQSKTATVVVTDVTGKMVYKTQSALGNGKNMIEIPASVISIKGIYMVQIVTGDQTRTEKLVSY
ncbi:MAG: T9SS type A sorting domain-containing protein [Sphingobacteriales bacterium]|nr:MAG: T9SS type A sorting domain-containing protein [Sphingobacteriales bacterium]